jgi:hypothetical protein
MARITQYLPVKFRMTAKRARRRARRLKGTFSSRRRPGVVVMLHIGRCGSTVLADMLGQHSEIFWDGKIYRAAQGMYGKELRGFDYRSWTMRQFAISGARYYGFEFKVLEDQYPAMIRASLRQFLGDCRSMGVTHYIILRRRNTLNQVVSHYASRARGSWHLKQGGQATARRFALDLGCIGTGGSRGKDLVSYLDDVEAVYQELDSLLGAERVLRIEYEPDIESAGPRVAYGKICEFLGVRADGVEIRNERSNPYGLSETVENLSAVAETLRGTRHAWMLGGDGPPAGGSA